MSIYKSIVLFIMSCYLPTAVAASSIAVGEQSAEGLAAISHELNTLGTTLLTSENIALSFNIQVAEEDVGFTSEIYLLAKIGELNYMRRPDKAWQIWDATMPVIATQALALSANEHLTVLDHNTLPAGEYLIYAGYKTRQGDIKYTENPTTLVVFSESSHNLHPISQPEVLHDYLYQAAINSQQFFYRYDDLAFTAAAFTSAESAPTTTTSGTTLQEAGVDEGDRIKTAGDLLFALQACTDSLQQSCLHSYQLQASPAQATEMGVLQLTDTVADYNYYTKKRLGELYLREAQGTTMRSLIWLNSSNSWQNKPSDYLNWAAYDASINLKFIDAGNPEQLSVKQQLTIEGELLASRLVDGVLYVLSRYSSYYQVPYVYPALGLPDPTGFLPDNTTDPRPDPIKPPLDFFLPHYYGDDLVKQALVSSQQCYIAPQNKDRYNQANLTMITAIPVDNPNNLESRCIAGNLETFYASPTALYFATSRYPYTTNGTQPYYDYGQEQVTEVHKFSLQSANMDYRGSGQATGHLGWDQEKKSFRFGEYQDTLRVASSEGSTWGIDSRTKITVFKEDSATQSLKIISTIENLGKPGERLYAARFLGDRGYLVTFKQTDPLIVIDFSRPEQPIVLGELEINGYSDYLQPLGNHYLLGIGKDALSDESGEVTWYQGVKVALFDVSSAENLREVNSLIIGKRGTDATVLHDHHGMALLASTPNHYKLALPIELHDTFSKPYFGIQNENSIYYNWTHTGLYVFDIDLSNEATLQLDGKLIVESATVLDLDEAGYYDFFNDRAVIQGQSIHYIHGNQVISAEIANLDGK